MPRDAAPPSPPTGSRKKKARIAAVELRDAIDAEIIKSDKLQKALDASEQDQKSLQARFSAFEAEMASLTAFRAASACNEERSGSCFNLEDRAPFEDRSAKCKAKSKLMRTLASLCAGKRGGAQRRIDDDDDEAPLSASMAKCETLVSAVLEEVLKKVLPGASAAYWLAAILRCLPLVVREHIETHQVLGDCIRRSFAGLKECHTSESIQNHSILCTAIAPPPALPGDQSGMRKKIAKLVGIPCGKNSVLKRQQVQRAAWDERQAKKGPIEVGESVVCTKGPGDVTALQADGSIRIKLDIDDMVTFPSLGAYFLYSLHPND